YRCNIQLTNARAGQRGCGQRNGVGHYQFVENGIFNVFDGAARQYRVGAVGIDTLGAVVLEGLGSEAQSAGCIDHVVDQYAGTALDITDDVHDFRHVGFRTTLVDDRQVDTEALGHGTRANHTTDVRRDDQ